MMQLLLILKIQTPTILQLTCKLGGHSETTELFIPLFVLVDRITKNENMLRDFLFDVFCLQGKTGKTKRKNTKKQTNYYIIFSFFITFVNQNEKLIR